MKKFSRGAAGAVLITVGSIAAGPGRALAQDNVDWRANTALIFGLKNLPGEWEPTDDQTEFGLQTDFRQEHWPISLAVDLSRSGSGTESTGVGPLNLKAEGRTIQLNLGIRKIIETKGAMEPFIGAGPTLIQGSIDQVAPGIDASDDDTGFGFWVDAGFYYPLASFFFIGAQVEYATAEIELFGSDLDAGGTHISGLAGFRWD